ncbi:MAG: DUF3293 domain-containing protein, partial [Leptospiraceae bacterium]|nr:DUF3293 domain-containing protein [Leptospiraceae bacterium]
ISNQLQNQRLKEALSSAGLSFYECVGRSPDGLHQEPSFAVALEEVRGREQLAYVASVAGRFEQSAIFLWNSRLRKGQTIWLAESSGDSP